MEIEVAELKVLGLGVSRVLGFEGGSGPVTLQVYIPEGTRYNAFYCRYFSDMVVENRVDFRDGLNSHNANCEAPIGRV